ncbi:MAG TPA: hypothetical protein VG759_17655, partial [Candidatus Angelobacter sp.]|nr:hypothetical protein [Candidatus Angelobacter sp.]
MVELRVQLIAVVSGLHPHALKLPKVHTVQFGAVVVTTNPPSASPSAAFSSSAVSSLGPAGLSGNHSSCSAERLRRYLGSL